MSSGEEDLQDSAHDSQDGHEDEHTVLRGIKKRRVQRACDTCRRKKVRCDGGEMPNNRCSNCIAYKQHCTYVEAAKKRGPPKGYIEGLENRIIQMEQLLRKVSPDKDIIEELGGPFDKEAWLSKGIRSSSKTASNKTLTRVPPSLPPVDADDLDPSDDELLARHTLEKDMRDLKLVDTVHPRFFGKSSSVMFLQTAMSLRKEYAGQEPVKRDTRIRNLLPCKRPEYWRAHPWVLETFEREHTHKEFPSEDLTNALVNKYFTKCNVYLPLLHRPTFEKALKEGLHLKDEGFGSTVLLVCALGSRYLDDPSVLLDGVDGQHSAGWKWFRQVHWVRRSLLSPPRLYDLQVAALTAMFLHGSSTPQASWTVIGLGIRLAQDVGAHRKKAYNPRTVEEELWKRAFWVLVALDRFISSSLGRPCAIHDEDFDLDLPVECDDEYWTSDDPKLAWKQPPGKPSYVAYFIAVLRLNQILAFALRTIYSINKSRVMLGFVGQKWEQHIVAELDSALNKWIDSVPDHLRWDPNQENDLFLNQSASLYASYYHLQISVHRPFIPSPRKPSALTFPSLAICTNAARSCVHVLDVQYKRAGGNAAVTNIMPLFASGIVLLLNIWGGKRSGVATDPVKEMEDVHRAMKMLRSLEDKWYTAGRIWDIMYELASVGELPLPQPSPPGGHKRDRSDADNETIPSPSSSSATMANSTPVTAPSSDEPRHIAGSRRVSQRQQQHSFSAPVDDSGVGTGAAVGRIPAVPQDAYTLPLHSDELGKLPLYPGGMADPSTLVSGSTGWFADFGALPPSSSSRPNDMRAPHVAGAAATSRPDLTTLAMGGTTSTDSQANTHAQTQSHSAMSDLMHPVFSSMVYDQALWSLSASLVPASANVPPASPPTNQTHAQQSAGHTQLSPLDTRGTQMQGESLEQLMLALGTDSSLAFLPDFASGDAEVTTLSMWSNTPAGFDWYDWGTYVNSFGGISDASHLQAQQRASERHPPPPF